MSSICREWRQDKKVAKKEAPKAAGRSKKDGNSKDCKRKFRNVWKETYTWLQYEEVKNTMHCVLCREAYFGQEKCVPFVEGTNNFKVSVIQKHERTSAHRNLLNKTEAERKKLANSFRAKKKPPEDSRSRFELLFKTVYEIQKNKLSFSQFPVLVNQQIQNGVPLEGRYTNHHHVVPDFSKYIATSMINDTVADIYQARHFGIVLDDVSNVVGSRKDAVYVTYLKDCTKRTRFLGLVENEDGVGIALAMVEMLAKFGFPSPFEKLLCLTTDGQPVHQIEGGLQMALGKEAPVLYTMDCLVHKVESSVKPVLYRHPQVRCCADKLYKLFCFFRDLRKKTGSTMDIWGPSSPVDQYSRSSEPQLLVLDLKFLTTILEKWGSVVAFLKDNYHNLDRKLRPDAAEMLTSLKSSVFIAYVHLLREIFEELHVFQERMTGCSSPACYTVLNELSITATAIADHIVLGPRLIPVLQELQERNGFFQGMAITQDFDIESFHVIAGEVCHCVSQQVVQMANQCSESLCKFSVLDPNNWPADSDVHFGAYGIETIRELSGEMQSLLPEKHISDIILEWCSYKWFVSNSLAKCLRKDFISLAATVVSRFSAVYPTICTFLTAAALLSPSCQVTRKGFEELCIIKESRKNVLTDDTLWQTMVINVNGAPLELWDPEPVVDLWLKTSLRRPNNRTSNKHALDTCNKQETQVENSPSCMFTGCQFLVITGDLCEEPVVCSSDGSG
uniref:TTF-type domain-containing protein n=1 Tax=Amblyomma triste TaxID=251400 RepID=A0A023GP17_AMBTT